MMETIEKRSENKTREQLAEMFIKSLDEQKLPWYAVWNTHPQQNAVSAKPYRGINAFLLSMVAAAFGYEDPRWCTFNQAKKKGWSIKKGAKGVPVEFWRQSISAQRRSWISVRRHRRSGTERQNREISGIIIEISMFSTRPRSRECRS